MRRNNAISVKTETMQFQNFMIEILYNEYKVITRSIKKKMYERVYENIT